MVEQCQCELKKKILSIVEVRVYVSARDTWLDRAKTPLPHEETTTLTSIEIPRRSTPNTLLSLSLSLNRDQLINNFPSLTVYFLPSKLSAADARTQHQPPPVVTPRGKTTDSRKTRQLSHTFLPLLLLLLPTDPIPLFHVALLVSSNPHRETIFRASPYSSSRYSSPSSTFSPRMKNLP